MEKPDDLPLGGIFDTQDGSKSIFSDQFGVSYHSKYGAVQESQHVFLNAALRFKAVLQKDISIFEMGFGTGLNAFLTLVEAQRRGLNIDYHAIEAYPIAAHLVAEFDYPAFIGQPQLATIYEAMHADSWSVPQQLVPEFLFTKYWAQLEEWTPPTTFDLIYFDAFAPNAQPELWSSAVFQKLFDALNPDGILTTYCAKGSVKRTLKACGFTVESIPGPPGKREMTRAVKL